MTKTTVPGLRTATERGHLVLALPPRTGWHNYTAIREALYEALTVPSARGHAGLVVDFGETVLMDASGLVLLARAQARARLLGRTLRLVVPPSDGRLRDALDATGLGGLVQVHPDIEAAVATPPRVVRPRDAAAPDPAQVLDAIRALHPEDVRLSRCLPDAELTITTAYPPGDDHVLVHVGGVLDQITVSRLGEALTTMIEKDAVHLRVLTHDLIRVRCDPLPVLLGIRWRACAEGGCLSLANLPPRLRQIIDREGLGPAFQCGRLTAPDLTTVS
ncbi:hypothetical protein GCM10023085_11930 [Actinomadura viridis]|uniref:Anti-anti-sigma regulatory factor n=1 Tax=Actinomadura viridis TaxID=58110 RepID=A0A931DRR5_9ACTN|nr:STAS domain-containing protein [Actinomadura viridis]MBG6093568.1 anti-anti-sigma regulatory factor [Actinomadura viridis]